MASSIPPQLDKTTKDRTTVAIVLTVLLHVLFAAIIYFTVFAKDSTVDPLSNAIEHSVTTPSLAIPTEAEITGKQKATLQTAASAPAQESDSATANERANSNKGDAEQATDSTTAQKPVTTLPNNSNKNTSVIDERAENQVSNPNSTLKASEQNNSSDYQLQRTQEYDNLEAEIERDSEQLSKLIAEVKKYNQNQIQQHRSPSMTAVTPSQQRPSTASDDYPLAPTSNIPSTPLDNNEGTGTTIEPEQ